jgi:hypothetical protein
VYTPRHKWPLKQLKKKKKTLEQIIAFLKGKKKNHGQP